MDFTEFYWLLALWEQFTNTACSITHHDTNPPPIFWHIIIQNLWRLDYWPLIKLTRAGLSTNTNTMVRDPTPPTPGSCVSYFRVIRYRNTYNLHSRRGGGTRPYFYSMTKPAKIVTQFLPKCFRNKKKLTICLEFWEKLAIYIIFNTVAIFISILIWKLNNLGATLFPPGGLSVIIINNNYCWNITNDKERIKDWYKDRARPLYFGGQVASNNIFSF